MVTIEIKIDTKLINRLSEEGKYAKPSGDVALLRNMIDMMAVEFYRRKDGQTIHYHFTENEDEKTCTELKRVLCGCLGAEAHAAIEEKK